MFRTISSTLKHKLASLGTAACVGVATLGLSAAAQATTLVWNFTGLVQQNFNAGGAVGPTGQTVSGYISFDPYHASAIQTTDGVSYADSSQVEFSPYPLALISAFASDGINTFDVNVLPSTLRTGYTTVARDASPGGLNGQLVGAGTQVSNLVPSILIQLAAYDYLGAASTFFNDPDPANFDLAQLADWLAPGVTTEFLFANELGWTEIGVITAFSVSVVSEPPVVLVLAMGLVALSFQTRRRA